MAARLHGGVHSPLLLSAAAATGAASPTTRPQRCGCSPAAGSRPVEQLIDRYGIACQPVRDVLVDYLRRTPARQSTSPRCSSLAYLLGKLFWADLEAHHPGIASLQLPRDIAAAWKQRVMTKTEPTTALGRQDSRHRGAARLDGRNVLTAVRVVLPRHRRVGRRRPAGGCPWAVRCPVSASEVSHKKDRTQRKSRMDQRTRERLPVLPALVAWVSAERNATAGRLQAAQAHRCGRAVHRRRADAAPVGDENPDAPAGSGPRTPPPASAVTSPSKSTAGSGPGRPLKCCVSPASASRS